MRCPFLVFILLLSSFFFFHPPALYAEEPEEAVEAAADSLQYLKEEHKLIAVGNVVVTHGEIELTADRAELQVDTKKAHATGHVVLRQLGGETLSGDEVSFDFKDSSGVFPNGRIFQFPWYGYGEKLEQVNKGKIVARDTFITSCNLPHPHYDVKAQEAIFYPGDKIIAKNVTFRILEVPVFWWPYLIIPLNNEAPFTLVPGYSNEYGAFLLASKGFSVNKNIHGRLHLDWYSKRGVGYGADVEYKFERLGFGEVKLYGIKDKDAPDQRADNPFDNKNRDDDFRGRVSWKHRARIDDLTTLQLQWHELSDQQLLQDFFEREHREEINPQSFLTITRNAGPYSLLAHIEKRTNRFETVAEKLPEVVFTWLRKPMFGTNFYYTSEEGFVNFDQTKSFSPDGPNTVQLYTDHELSYPLQFFRFYNVIPFVNFREDYFTKSREKEDGITRYVFGGGFDASTRFYRTWDYQGTPMGIEVNGLRHVLEPLIQYNSIKVASVNPGKLVVTGRGDQLDHQDIVTFGVENRIQTKRRVGNSKEYTRVDLVSFNAFLDYSFGPGSELLRTRANKFTDARFETVFRPYDWLVFRMDTEIDVISQKIFTNDIDLVFDPGRWQVTLSHRYARNREHDSRTVSNTVFEIPHLSIDDGGGSNQITMDLVYDLNERWDFGGYIRWEVSEGESNLEEWEIRAQRDLHDWLLDFGLNVRNSDRTDSEKQLNKEVFVQLQLKALPSIELKTGHRASFVDSRIGRTVSGSNEAPPPPSFLGSPDAQYVSLSTS
ncbi:MAG: LPS-assembly protein LptD [Candidatus Omnitrophica bacterium]|nr:LPS-assembly protein LptD [Candidatus Omnitrophota bacterium]